MNGGLIRLAGVTLKKEDVLNGHLEQIPITVFLRKRKGWEHEHEHRLVIQLSKSLRVGSDDNGHTIHLFHIPPEAIKSITFGYRFKDDAVDYAGHRLTALGWDHVRLFRRVQDRRGALQESPVASAI